MKNQSGSYDTYSNFPPPQEPSFLLNVKSLRCLFWAQKGFPPWEFLFGYSIKYIGKIEVWVLELYCIGHIVHIVTVIYNWSLSNYLREGKDDGVDGFGLNRFGGGPEGGPGGAIDAWGRFLGACLFVIVRDTNFFGMRIWGFGFGFMRFKLAASSDPRFRFACFFFGITISSKSESSSSESSSLKALHSGSSSFFHRDSGKNFFISKDPFFPDKNLSPKDIVA